MCCVLWTTYSAIDCCRVFLCYCVSVSVGAVSLSVDLFFVCVYSVYQFILCICLSCVCL